MWRLCILEFNRISVEFQKHSNWSKLMEVRELFVAPLVLLMHFLCYQEIESVVLLSEEKRNRFT